MYPLPGARFRQLRQRVHPLPGPENVTVIYKLFEPKPANIGRPPTLARQPVVVSNRRAVLPPERIHSQRTSAHTRKRARSLSSTSAAHLVTSALLYPSL